MSAFSHWSAMRGVAGLCLLRERALLSAVGRFCAAGAYVDVAGGLVCATDGLVPVLAQSSTRFVEELAFVISCGFCLLFAIPDGWGLAVADRV